ncbi:hypothetical protein HYX58_04490 [Candidatus Dependentiae bacterium]|nr:hypothetical protein [Candidatus Dependentiae bacterium]
MKLLLLIFAALSFQMNAALHHEKNKNPQIIIYDNPSVLSAPENGSSKENTKGNSGVPLLPVEQGSTTKMVSPRPTSPNSVSNSVFLKKDKVERNSTGVPNLNQTGMRSSTVIPEEEIKNGRESGFSKKIREFDVKKLLVRKEWRGMNRWIHADIVQQKQQWREFGAGDRIECALKYLETIEDNIQKWKIRKIQLSSVSDYTLPTKDRDELDAYKISAQILARPIEDRTANEKDILITIKQKYKVEESDFYDQYFKLQYKGYRVPPALLRDFVLNPLLVLHDLAITNDGKIEPNFIPLVDDNELEQNEKVEQYKYSAPKRSTLKILGDFKQAVKKWEAAYYEKEDQLISRQKKYEKFSDASKFMEISSHDEQMKKLEESCNQIITDQEKQITLLAATNESLKKGVSPSSRRNGFLVGAASATAVCTVLGTFVWWKSKK